MPKQVKLLKVMIASPSDVAALRDHAREAVLQWNSAHTDACEVVLMPIMWEYDVVPGLGGAPQAMINAQIVDDSDMLIGIFHSRLGTPTGQASSGTVEEIDRFLKSGRPVTLFFCQAPLPSTTDPQQLQALRDYQASCEPLGLLGSFTEPHELRAKLQQYLTRTVSCGDAPTRRAEPHPATGTLAKASLELFFRREFPMWWAEQSWYRIGVRNNGPVAAENVVVTLEPIEPNPLPLNVLPAQLGKKDGGTMECRINPGDEAYFDVVRHWPDTNDLLQLWTVPAMGQEFRLDPAIDYRTRIKVSAANADQHGPVHFTLRQRDGDDLWFGLSGASSGKEDARATVGALTPLVLEGNRLLEMYGRPWSPGLPPDWLMTGLPKIGDWIGRVEQLLSGRAPEFLPTFVNDGQIYRAEKPVAIQQLEGRLQRLGTIIGEIRRRID